MSTPATSESFLKLTRQAGVADEKRLDAYLKELGAAAGSNAPHELVDRLVQAGLLTSYQAVQLLKGKTDCFKIGSYRILERLGFGAVSNVYLCEHQTSRQRVAVKVLTRAKAEDPVALKRFYREARASASMDHPNIVRVHDVDSDDQSHFMVMDFVDGSSIQDIVQHFGPMDVSRCAHYIRQAAQGLQYAHEHGLVHRDIKPGNLLIDRQGTAKILDLGLARFAQDEESPLTQGGEVLGAPEYLAPEQGKDSHNVDIRADIYSLGATLYFMLSGQPPYSQEKTLAAKLLAKETRPPESIRTLRPEVPAELAVVVDTMLAKLPAYRYQTPGEVVEALAPWTEGPIDPPSDQEMPQLSPAVRAEPEPTPTVDSAAVRRSAAKVATETVRATEGSVRANVSNDSPVRTDVMKRADIPAKLVSRSSAKRRGGKASAHGRRGNGWMAQAAVLLVLGAVAVAAAWLVMAK